MFPGSSIWLLVAQKLEGMQYSKHLRNFPKSVLSWVLFVFHAFKNWMVATQQTIHVMVYSVLSKGKKSTIIHMSCKWFIYSIHCWFSYESSSEKSSMKLNALFYRILHCLQWILILCNFVWENTLSQALNSVFGTQSSGHCSYGGVYCPTWYRNGLTVLPNELT